ncbi:hypothetical protein [Sphingobium sp. MP9-4]|uniref:hypothetical protein n=1 Tax=Sphingobium sp. MP9-4 TaxID=1761936 RepID=UPI0010CA6BAA|nr:hypothetical protein [Sphingobium sp. MP9-4]
MPGTHQKFGRSARVIIFRFHGSQKRSRNLSPLIARTKIMASKSRLCLIEQRDAIQHPSRNRCDGLHNNISLQIGFILSCGFSSIGLERGHKYSMKKENSPENFGTWSFGYDGCDDDSCFDDDGAISIWKVLTAPVHPTSDPRYLSANMRDRLVRHRVAQMEQEAERRIATLHSIARN